ncbi:hypothetical protein [Pelagibaculum spongiae]|uniref:hypothetical protein n=1 Tax=Pelagibaculum spongiae TaxID=2080658 RepID=UPI0013147C36|nr:hypothetical protein [Pelagibaculum spongiae]
MEAIHSSPELVRSWSDRYFGIGFDQLLVVEALKNPNIDFAIEFSMPMVRK